MFFVCSYRLGGREIIMRIHKELLLEMLEYVERGPGPEVRDRSGLGGGIGTLNC
jgi:hypothetical protein